MGQKGRQFNAAPTAESVGENPYGFSPSSVLRFFAGRGWYWPDISICEYT